MPLQIRRGTNAERLTLTPVTGLKEGEIIYVTDEQRLYIGTGRTGEHQGVPVTNITYDDAKDAASDALTGGTHQNISFVYDNINSVINATVDLSNYQGLIRADALRGSLFADDSSLLVNAVTGEFNGTLNGDSVGYHTGDIKGSVFADDSSLLVDGVSGTFNLAGTVKGNIYPADDSVYDLGAFGAAFKDLYLSGSSIFLGDAQITSVGTAVNLPAGSTVNGILIGSGSGVGDGVVRGSDYNINIVGDDSSLIVDSSTGTLYGNLIGDTTGYHTGDVKGSVYSADLNLLVDALNSRFNGDLVGDVTGDVVGNLTGSVLGDVKGSVFADDSSLLIDGLTGTIYGYFEGQATLNAVKIYSDVWFRDVGVSIYSASNAGGGGWVDCNVSDNTTESPTPLSQGTLVGGYRVQAYNDNLDFVTVGGIASQLTASSDLSSSNPASDTLLIAANDGSFSVYTFKHNGNFVSPGAITPGVYATTAARDTAIPTPSPGMMVYVTATSKFYGYVDDDGSLGGSPAVPNWVALN